MAEEGAEEIAVVAVRVKLGEEEAVNQPGQVRSNQPNLQMVVALCIKSMARMLIIVQIKVAAHGGSSRTPVRM